MPEFFNHGCFTYRLRHLIRFDPVAASLAAQGPS
jgi:hypothetical protein